MSGHRAALTVTHPDGGPVIRLCTRTAATPATLLAAIAAVAANLDAATDTAELVRRLLDPRLGFEIVASNPHDIAHRYQLRLRHDLPGPTVEVRAESRRDDRGTWAPSGTWVGNEIFDGAAAQLRTASRHMRRHTADRGPLSGPSCADELNRRAALLSRLARRPIAPAVV